MDLVYRNGVRVEDPAVDRGRLLICSADEMRDRLLRRAMHAGSLVFALVFFMFIVLADWSSPVLPTAAMLAEGRAAPRAGRA